MGHPRTVAVALKLKEIVTLARNPPPR